MALKPGYYLILDRDLRAPETVVGPYTAEQHALEESDWLVGSQKGERILLQSEVERVLVRHTDHLPKYLCEELTSLNGSIMH